MNKIRIGSLLVLGLLMTVSFAYGQSDTLNRTDKFGKKYGKWVQYENGNLSWTATFYNGEPVGVFIHYYPNKRIKDSLYYHPNSPKVDAVIYHSNGKKASEGLFINKIKDGKWLYYSADGILIGEDNFKLGKKQGISKTFSPEDGVLLREEHWDNDKLHGAYKEFYITGQLRLIWHYNQGKIDGAYECYYLNGSVWKKGQYLSNTRHGTWIYYDPDGNETKIEEINRERITKTILGFKTPDEWVKYDARAIAYFYQNPGENIYIQLRNKNTVMLTEDNSLQGIFSLADVELFIFLNDNVLSSYEAIKKVTVIEPETEDGEEEAEIMLFPTPPFPVISYGSHYQSLKQLMDTSAPTPEGNE